MYLDKDYREDEIQVKKYMAMMSLFRQKDGVDKKDKEYDDCRSWKKRPERSWRGENMSKRRVKNMHFSMILQATNTRGGVFGKETD